MLSQDLHRKYNQVITFIPGVPRFYVDVEHYKNIREQYNIEHDGIEGEKFSNDGNFIIDVSSFKSKRSRLLS